MLIPYRTTVEDMDISVFFSHPHSILPNVSAPMHDHLSYEMHAIRSGSMSFSIDNEPYLLTAGHVLLIPPHIFHKIHAVSPDISKFSFEFSVSKNPQSSTGLYKACKRLLEDKLDRPAVLTLSIPELSEIIDIFSGQYQAPSPLRAMTPPLMQAYLSIIFFKILFNLEHNATIRKITAPASATDAPKAASPRAVYITQYIASFYRSRPSVHDLAKELHLSVRQTERLIKSEMNTSFSGLLNEHRIKLARHLIRLAVRNRQSVSFNTLAEDVGFDNYYTFLKQFKRYTGATPNEYKNQLDNKPD